MSMAIQISHLNEKLSDAPSSGATVESRKMRARGEEISQSAFTMIAAFHI